MDFWRQGFGLAGGVCMFIALALVLVMCVPLACMGGLASGVADDGPTPIYYATPTAGHTVATPTNTRVVPPTETPTRVPGSVCDCSANLYNCDTFAQQSHAQECYDYCVSIQRGDVHDLDRDKDGIACENSR